MTSRQRKHSPRYTLLLYQNGIDQIWPASLFLGIALLAAWFFSERLLPNLSAFQDAVLFICSLVALAIATLTFLARKASYVQAYPDHFRLVTPFLRLKVSYQRLTGLRATQFQALFSPQKIGFWERGSLKPFFAATVVLVELNGYPISQRTMRLFLPKRTFAPGGNGLVLLVDDWMNLSHDLDHFSLQWRQSRLSDQTHPLSKTGLLGRLPKH